MPARVTPSDLIPIRSAIAHAQRALGDLIALDADAAGRVVTEEAERLDRERHGAELRGQVAAARAGAVALPLSALGAMRTALRVADEQLGPFLVAVDAGAAVANDSARLGTYLAAAADELDALAELLRRHEARRPRPALAEGV